MATKNKTEFKNIWSNIKTRCNNKNRVTSKFYIGKGITYDPKWELFSGFQEDMEQEYLVAKQKHGDMKLSIERLDNDGNYCKENCTFIPWKWQYMNRGGKQVGFSDFIATEIYGNVSYYSDNLSQFCREKELDERAVQRCLSNERNKHHGFTFSYLYREKPERVVKRTEYITRFRNIYKNRKYHHRFFGQMCDEWFDNFSSFEEDMFESFVQKCKEIGEKNVYLCLINKDGSICKDNCFWGDSIDNGKHKARKIVAEREGEILNFKSLKDAMSHFGISKFILNKSLENNIPYDGFTMRYL